MKNEKETTKTTEMVTISRAEYDKLVAERDWLKEQLTVLKKNLFGSKSEKATEELDGQMRLLFDEPEMYAFVEEAETQEKEPEPKETEVAGYVRKEKSPKKFVLDSVPEGAAVEVTEHRLTSEQLICPNCGSIMEEIGVKKVRTLEMIPAQYVVHEDWYYTYACKNCCQDTLTDNRTQIVETPHVPSVYPGSCASPSAIAHLMVQKYVMGTPLYRMEMEFRSRGFALSRQTMSNWMIHSTEKWLKPIYDELHRRLVRKDIIHADETELQVLHEKDRKATTKSYMWLYRTGKFEEYPIVLYEYCQGRSGNYPKNFLDGFTGYLQTDGYAGYNLVPGVTHVGCMAHLRRKFHEAVVALPAGKKTGSAVEGEAFCTELFRLEGTYTNLSPEDRKLKREQNSKLVLDKFILWGSTRHAAQKSKLGEALTYLNNNHEALSAWLKDGRLEISNNLAERSIKPFVIDRKNFLFANTPKGAESSAVTFSIIETAKENGLDPFKYLTYVFTQAPILEQTDPDWAVKLLPENAPAECKAQ